MPNLRPMEILLIAAIILLLFGAKRLPDAARSVGRSLRIFKAETKGLADGPAEIEVQVEAEEQPNPAQRPEV